MSLSRDDVRRLAELARLNLDDAELDQQQKELERILGYVARLSKIDTKHTPETEVVSQEMNFREDQELPCDEVEREIILSNFPDRAGDALRVPAVFEKPKG